MLLSWGKPAIRHRKSKSKQLASFGDLVGTSVSHVGQGAGHSDEDMQRAGGSRYLNDEGAQLDSSHDVTPGCIHLPEGAAFLGDLLHDFLRAEDGLQVQPLALPHAAETLNIIQLLLTIAV